MPPDELIPSPKRELSLGKTGSDPITAGMAEDLLALHRKKDVLAEQPREKHELAEKKAELADDAIVHFKCPNLEKAIRKKLEKLEGPINRRDMASLKKLFCGKMRITDLSGLEYATNLSQLNLRENQITDISPLADLTNLTELYLHKNQITDISPLADLTSLTYLWLRKNQITDISPLAGLTNLTKLDLWENQITDVSPLVALTSLTEVNLSYNQITRDQRQMLRNALPNCKIEPA